MGGQPDQAQLKRTESHFVRLPLNSYSTVVWVVFCPLLNSYKNGEQLQKEWMKRNFLNFDKVRKNYGN